MLALKKQLKIQYKVKHGLSKSDISDKSKGGTDLSLISKFNDKVFSGADDRSVGAKSDIEKNYKSKQYDEDMFGSKAVEVDLEDAKEGSRGSIESNNKSVVSRISQHLQDNVNKVKIKLMEEKNQDSKTAWIRQNHTIIINDKTRTNNISQTPLENEGELSVAQQNAAKSQRANKVQMKIRNQGNYDDDESMDDSVGNIAHPEPKEKAKSKVVSKTKNSSEATEKRKSLSDVGD